VSSLSEAPQRSSSQTLVPRRVVLLGASNLTKGIGAVVTTAQAAWGRPLEVWTALGHGRSYGRASRAFGRQLPGILQCGLWHDLGAAQQQSTAALVTDIGNDLIYEEPVEQIATWVEQCLDRLAAMRARTVVTSLPLATLDTLSRARFRLLRSVFFPHSRIGLEEVASRAHSLDERVRRLASERGFDVVDQRRAWYGFDPIHIRFAHRNGAWREILSPWSTTGESFPAADHGFGRTLYLRSRAPHYRRVLGVERRRAQPSARLRDGTTVAIY
jgi:hypothetical protein